MMAAENIFYQDANGERLSDASQPIPQSAARYTPHVSTRYIFVAKSPPGKQLPELYANRSMCCGCSACMASCPMSGKHRPEHAHRHDKAGNALMISCRNAGFTEKIREIPHTGAITMLPDEEGFLYPVVDAGLCVRCYQCLAACDFSDRISHRKEDV